MPDTIELPLDEPVAQPTTRTQTLHFTFTGSGAEYFRIWIVNLLLTVATLGIYSAWAKVRRLQYFDRNTRLAGACFDFRGNPKAILRGRIVGVVLLAAYQYAFGFSVNAGAAVLAVLLLSLPFLMRGALRFRLSNTYYRGLAFGFSGSAAGAYRAYLPPVATFFVPSALVTLFPNQPWLGLTFACYLGWPLMHGAMKHYQHAHLRFGAEASRYTVPARRFFRPYFRAGLILAAGVVAVGLCGLGAVWAGVSNRDGFGGLSPLGALLAALSAYVFYLLVTPYLQVRVANLAWSDTTFPGVRIDSRLQARPFVRLQTVNTLLTLATLGLYRPFAVVRVYRYRLAHLALTVEGSVTQIAAGASAARPGAAGDGVADFLGVDLSW